MSTLQVLILIIDEPHNLTMIGSTLDANAVEDQSTTNKPTVDVKYKGRPRWTWTDAVSRKIRDDNLNGTFDTEDGLLFRFATYDVHKTSMHVIDWVDSSDVGNVEAMRYLREQIDTTVSSFENLDASNNAPFNNDSECTFHLTLLGTKDFDETTNSKFAMVRKSQLLGGTGVASISAWTQRYWWEIKEIDMDGLVRQAKLKSCCPPLLLKELGLDQWPDASDDSLEGEADEDV
ncbi:hypothetical protein G6011_06624 [Alternaria panax]|uniref:Uncharacterized protein n=1 Tax=Alternaria panax TaxID=48097 RepID=A0AAD4FHJ9_9PLEO|nr:hypothetical protein G6011_06624 [Alternaria panax]